MVRLKFSRFVTAFVLAALLGVVYAACATQAQTTSKTSHQEKAAAIAALAKIRVDAAKEMYDGLVIGMNQTRGSGATLHLVAQPEEAYLWSVRWLNAQRDMRSGKESRVTALEEHVTRMKELQKCASDLTQGLLPGSWGLSAPRYYVAEAECWLAQEKAK